MRFKKHLLQGISDYIIDNYHIDTSKTYLAESIPAKQLIVPQRIDLMAKWMYIDAYEKKMNLNDAIALYAAHLDAFSFGSFVEPGQENKNSLKVYLDAFNHLIEDIRENGFDEEKSVIPVGNNNVILDGSHRVAVAAYYNKNVTVIRFPECTQEFGFTFFYYNLLNRKYLNQMVMEFLQLSQNCYFACLWSVAYNLDKMKEAEAIIREYGYIINISDVKLSYNGMRNFMVQIYGHQKWVGTYENHFSGVDDKVQACFKKGEPVRTVVFEASKLDDVLEIKRRIRAIYGLENHSIHISDSIDETRQMAELLYNENSLHHLNFGIPDNYNTIHKRIVDLKDLVHKKGLDIGHFIVDSGSVLEAYGLRQSRDMDYLTDYLEPALPQTDDCDNHISQLVYYGCSIEDLLYNPNNYFVYNGIKFVALSKLLTLKYNRNEKKDRRDIRLIKKCFNKSKEVLLFSEEKILIYERKHKMYGRGILTRKEYIKYRIGLR